MTTALVILVALIVLAGIVVAIGHLPFGIETYTISTRDIPNTAAELHSAPRHSAARP